MKLTPKQKKFCDYYMSSGNATESAVKAGYSKKTARVIGQENLLKPAIKDYIASHTIKDDNYRMLDVENRQKWLSDILEGKIKEKKTIIALNGSTVVIEEDAKIDTLIKANEQLNKMQGVYLERVEVSGKLDTNIINNIEEQIKEKGIR